MNKIELTKELKVKLLKAIKTGELDLDSFPEFLTGRIQIIKIPDNGRNCLKNKTDE